MKKITLRIAGMHCASCAQNIKLFLEKDKAVARAEVNFAANKAFIEFDETKIDKEKIRDMIKQTGYEVILPPSNHMHQHDHPVLNEDDRKLKIKTIFALLLSLPLLLRMVWMWEIPGELWGISLTGWIQNVLAGIVVFFLGWQFHRNAFRAMLRWQADMDTLISLGTLASYFFSFYALFADKPLYFEGAATITALILLGRYMETKTKNRASAAMKKLMELGAKNARIITKDGQEIETGLDQVRVDDIILVKAGEKIPLDGEVIEGSASVDESMISGESLPVTKESGSDVFAATINQDGILKIKVTKRGEDTLLAQIIKTVEEAQSFKAPTQKLADKISGIFVPVVISLSILTFAGWMLATGDLSRSLMNAVAVLIISCPCALGIATPIAIMVGSSVGAKKGILIKNGESFEKAKIIDTIIFDKTGTLTEGKPQVKEIIANPDHGFPADKIIKIAYSLAKLSIHPMSLAIDNFAQTQANNFTTVDRFEEIPGHGIIGYCQTHAKKILLGNYKLAKGLEDNTGWREKIIEQYKTSEYSLLFVGHDQAVVGAILLSDTLKPNAKQAIDDALALGIEPIMISGDNRHAVQAIADKLGIKNFLAEVLPQDKQLAVKKIQANGKKVIFAGDGINDAPALVQADLGIAMASGTDIAREAGDIIIMKNEPEKIIEAIKLSQKTFQIIKMNLFWAFFYNILAIPLAMLGFISPMVGALAMSLSDITVIGNSMRLYRIK